MNAYGLQYLIILASGFWFDRWTKNLALKFLNGAEYFVTTWLNFSLQMNKGVSFSWFASESTLGYIMLTIAVFAIIVLFVFYAVGQYRLGYPLYGECCVLAGAVSNFIDRIQYGGVIDFIDFHIGSWHFPTFNIADIYICTGITWLVLVQVKEVYDAQSKKNS